MKIPYYLFFIPLLNFRYKEQMSLMTVIYNLDCISWFVVYVCLIPVVWNYVMSFMFCYVIWINMWHFWTCFVCTCVLYSCDLFPIKLSYDRVIDLQNDWMKGWMMCVHASVCLCVRACVHAHVCVCMVVYIVANACTRWQ